MENGNPIWWTVSSVLAGGMALVGIGLLFVRARNIERRWVVALSTLLGAGLAIYMLSVQPVWAGGQDTSIPLLAGIVSVLGFIVGRIVDVMMGPRHPDDMRRDPATYTADLAD